MGSQTAGRGLVAPPSIGQIANAERSSANNYGRAQYRIQHQADQGDVPHCTYKKANAPNCLFLAHLVLKDDMHTSTNRDCPKALLLAVDMVAVRGLDAAQEGAHSHLFHPPFPGDSNQPESRLDADSSSQS